MKTLKESILSDMDSTIDSVDNAYSVLYPVPTVKDFVKTLDGNSITWQCPELIKQYIHEFKFDKDKEYISAIKNSITGIRCVIYKDKTIATQFVDEYSDFGYIDDICGVGDWVSNSLSVSKKVCVEFLKKLAANPDVNFKKVIDCNNKCIDELKKYGAADCKNYIDLLK